MIKFLKKIQTLICCVSLTQQYFCLNNHRVLFYFLFTKFQFQKQYITFHINLKIKTIFHFSFSKNKLQKFVFSLSYVKLDYVRLNKIQRFELLFFQIQIASNFLIQLINIQQQLIKCMFLISFIQSQNSLSYSLLFIYLFLCCVCLSISLSKTKILIKSKYFYLYQNPPPSCIIEMLFSVSSHYPYNYYFFFKLFNLQLHMQTVISCIILIILNLWQYSEAIYQYFKLSTTPMLQKKSIRRKLNKILISNSFYNPDILFFYKILDN
ncbi:transmembrane protein, putative (macronuclear) [Tetrahymena thermophila SB210]|uniref:Transmembrane protein, putative n=1 Tax=Tetrahymena thermophila (strain SB210) TaxID=312017 RepID=W7XJL1_TETTS|nr:transmembrane protein, putative [Tetrahymena thermophila SB210]EWS74244.1 transmembrane protein, putative [Tetrahymena thermophila SB210]|eukprot:XP_012653217.1 transmembrane protein, putative [Tetrahymena thermophila SB210]